MRRWRAEESRAVSSIDQRSTFSASTSMWNCMRQVRPDRERLVRAGPRCRPAARRRRQGERLRAHWNDTRLRRWRRRTTRAPPGVGTGHRLPADFPAGDGDDAGAERPRHQLPAEAMADHRHAAFHGLQDQRSAGLAQRGVVVGAHLAAQDGEVRASLGLRKGLPSPVLRTSNGHRAAARWPAPAHPGLRCCRTGTGFSTASSGGDRLSRGAGCHDDVICLPADRFLKVGGADRPDRPTRWPASPGTAHHQPPRHAFGPAAIRAASHMLCDGTPPAVRRVTARPPGRRRRPGAAQHLARRPARRCAGWSKRGSAATTWPGWAATIR